MGDRHSDGGARARRHAHRGGARPGPLHGPDGPALESLIAGVLRAEALDADDEQRAVAAFRAARETAVHGVRTRRRDDWRPREHRRTRRSVRVTFTLSLAGLTLGGVAFAAIDSVHGSSHDGHVSRQQTHAPAAPSGTAAAHTPGPTDAPDRPETAKDAEAHCQAYEKVKDSGQAMESTAWQRLIAAAGGEENVAAYCAAELAEPTAASTPSATDRPKNPQSTQRGKASRNPNAGSSGGSGSSGVSGSSGGSAASAAADSGKKDK
ncbi:hypothetical protein ACIRPX_24810 [Streptomyces sp. NPDC101225]|uniref:hypothetical protein n=1 Tax=Streptomyces sp. NPDC101225 TaxID=3366135 RepID=UPI0037F4AA95